MLARRFRLRRGRLASSDGQTAHQAPSIQEILVHSKRPVGRWGQPFIVCLVHPRRLDETVQVRDTDGPATGLRGAHVHRDEHVHDCEDHEHGPHQLQQPASGDRVERRRAVEPGPARTWACRNRRPCRWAAPVKPAACPPSPPSPSRSTCPSLPTVSSTRLANGPLLPRTTSTPMTEFGTASHDLPVNLLGMWAGMVVEPCSYSSHARKAIPEAEPVSSTSTSTSRSTSTRVVSPS